MKRDPTRCLPFVLCALLTFTSLPVLSQAPQPEVACPPCDDLNACTTDTCDTITGTCRYEAVSCDDGNPCTSDACYGDPHASPCGVVAGCCHLPLSNFACDDGNSCTGSGQCQSGTCVVTTLPQGTACDDQNSCTELDTCSASGACVGLAVAGGSPCSDGTACTTGDVCASDGSGGVVCSGAPVNCSDSDPCTQDLCNSTTGACSNPPVNCDDGNQCTTDSLACSDGLVCNHLPRTGSCQDADPCTPSDFCSAGVCVRSGNCDDHIDCTLDACSPGIGCAHYPQDSLCTDDLYCTVGERCEVGRGCTFRAPGGNSCPTGNVCTLGVCEQNGQCHVFPKCGDANGCTQDLCDASSGVCSFPSVPDGTTCINSCSPDATCQAGLCVGSEPGPGAGLPILSIQSVSPTLLLHANHKLIEVHATVVASTECGQPLVPLLLSITSSQPDDAPGPSDGHTTDDIQGAVIGGPDFDFLLRAEFDRNSLVPRTYMITYYVTANGFTVTRQASVRVYQKKATLPAGTATPKKGKSTRD